MGDWAALLPEPYPGHAQVSARVGLALLSVDPVPGPSQWRAWNRRGGRRERAWYHSQSQDETSGVAMTGPEHYRRAEELAAEAHRLLGQGDGQATASVWAAVAQAHAVLALAAATAVGASGADNRAWADAAGTGFGSGRGDH